MEFALHAVPSPAHRYRLPALLHDIRLLDLLELSGTTQDAARLAFVSQPTVSRRTRLLAHDFSLEVNHRRLGGCRYGTSPAMRLLRLGCRAHRLMAGVARIGADVILHPLLAQCGWLLPAPPRFRRVESWLELVRQGVLDGALLSGLEFAADVPPDTSELELLQLGELPLALVTARSAVTGHDAIPPAVLVPRWEVAPGLQRALAQQGLTLKAAVKGCQSPEQWLERLVGSPSLAMPLPALAPADWWQPLHWQPLPQPLLLPLWLVLPAGWQRHTVLAHTAEQLRVHRALSRGERA